MRKSILATVGLLCFVVGCSSADRPVASQEAPNKSRSDQLETSTSDTQSDAESNVSVEGPPVLPEKLPDLPSLPQGEAEPQVPEHPPLPGEEDGPLLVDPHGAAEAEKIPLPPTVVIDGEAVELPGAPELPDLPEGTESLGPPAADFPAGTGPDDEPLHDDKD